MNYWLDLFTGTTWTEFRESGANLSGFRHRMRKAAAKVKGGDVFLCYLTGVMRWVGALEMIGPSTDTRPIWKDAVLIEKCGDVMGVVATYVQATPDLMMGDLLKNMRASQIFSVCGLLEVMVSKVQSSKSKVSSTTKPQPQYQVELLGLDVFDPINMEVDHQSGNDVPAWSLDTDCNGTRFHLGQAFFPRTGAWENLKKALRGDYVESVWDHLAGTISAPFSGGEHGQVAVKVIDQRGNGLRVVKRLKEART